MKVDQWYSEALAMIMNEGIRESHKRTGIECASLPGLTFQTDLQKDGIPLTSLRKIPVKNFIAEQCWFLSGSSNVKELEKWTKIWSAFANENGTVSSAYGRRWVKWFRNNAGYVNQLAVVLDKLRRDPSSRHGVVMMWDPAVDLLVPQKNVPCPYTFTLMVIGGRLHLHLTVRSNDMVLGFPTDAAGFGWLAYVLAKHLGVQPGIYTHSISNAHIYSNHYDAANQMLARNVDDFIQNPIHPHFYADVLGPASFMDKHFIDSAISDIDGQYFPAPAITGLTIAL